MSDVRHIQGLEALQRYFREFPADVSKKVLRRMAGAGAQVVRAATSDRIPIGKSTPRHVAGTLKRSLRVVYRREDSNENQAVFAVTFRQGKGAQGRVIIGKKTRTQSFQLSADAYYASFVERGHRSRGGGHVSAHPFLEPAFVGVRQEAEDRMIDVGQQLVKDKIGV